MSLVLRAHQVQIATRRSHRLADVASLLVMHVGFIYTKRLSCHVVHHNTSRRRQMLIQCEALAMEVGCVCNIS